MFRYSQKTGQLAQDIDVLARGYSGLGRGRNNPDYQSVLDQGPIPQGEWIISGPPIDTAEHGPYVLRLTPAPGTNTFGRSGFLMHGDSMEHPGEASKGCVILPRLVREHVWDSNDRKLVVTA